MNWRIVENFPGYEVSDEGEVRGLRKILAQAPNEGGYMRVRLRRADGSYVWRRVHTLVLEAFEGPRPSALHHGAHGPDRDKRNNAASNLRWALPEENEADKRAHGTQPRGGRSWRPNRSRVERVLARVAAGESYSAIAKSEGLHRHSVSRIARGLRHGDVQVAIAS